MKNSIYILFFFLLLTLFLHPIGCSEEISKPVPASDSSPVSADDYESLLEQASTISTEALMEKNRERYEEAIDACQKAIQQKPDLADGYRRLGQLYNGATVFFHENNKKEELHQKAKKQFQKALEINPKSDELYYDLASSQLSLNELSEAEASLKKALQINPENRYATIDLGIQYYKQGEYPLAEKYLTQYVSNADPKAEKIVYIRAAEFLGRVYLKQGKLEQAEQILKSSVGNYDQYLDEHGNTNYWGCPYQALGELYLMTGDSSKEQELFLKAAEMEIFRPWMQWEGAQRSYLIGDYKRSLAFIHRLYKLKDKPDYHLMEGLILIGLKRYEEAESIFLKWKNESGSSVGFGHLALVRKDYPKAKSEFHKFLKSFKARALFLRKIIQKEKDFLLEFDWVCYEMAHLGLGWMYSNQNQHEKALADYDKILSVRPNHLLALLGKGNALSGLKRMDEAEAVFNQTLKYYPGNKYAITELGIVKYNKGDYRSAEEDFKFALEKDAQNYTCPYEGMGLIFLQQGETEKAKEFFEKAIEINPDIEYKKYNGLARIYIQEGKMTEARKMLLKSIENYPYDKEAKELLEKIDKK